MCLKMGFPGGSDSEDFACNAGDLGLDPWVGKMPWRKEWLPTTVFLPERIPWTEDHKNFFSRELSKNSNKIISSFSNLKQ